MAYESASPIVGVSGALDPAAPVVSVPHMRVTLKRDPMTEIPTDIREHELALVQALYGEENVTVVKTFDMEVPETSVDEEYARLLAKYKLTRTKVVQDVFPTKKALADEMGVAYRPARGARRAEQLPGSLVVENYDPRMSNVSGGDEVGGIEAEIAKAQAEADAKIAALKQRLGEAKEDEKAGKASAKAVSAKEPTINAAKAQPVVIVNADQVAAAKAAPKVVKPAVKKALAKKGK